MRIQPYSLPDRLDDVYGQLLIILPKSQAVILQTGWDIPRGAISRENWPLRDKQKKTGPQSGPEFLKFCDRPSYERLSSVASTSSG